MKENSAVFFFVSTVLNFASTVLNFASTVFFDTCARDNLRGQKSLGPLKMSLEMAHKVILPPKKNYIPQFLKQRDINSYNIQFDIILSIFVLIACTFAQKAAQTVGQGVRELMR